MHPWLYRFVFGDSVGICTNEPHRCKSTLSRPRRHLPHHRQGAGSVVAPPAATEPQVLSGPEEVRVECLAEVVAPPRYQEMKRPES
jgi:hypothetical protein